MKTINKIRWCSDYVISGKACLNNQVFNDLLKIPSKRDRHISDGRKSFDLALLHSLLVKGRAMKNVPEKHPCGQQGTFATLIQSPLSNEALRVTFDDHSVTICLSLFEVKLPCFSLYKTILLSKMFRLKIWGSLYTWK